MMDVIGTIVLAALFLIVVEGFRWMSRPEAKRLRLIKKMKKIGGR